MANQKISALTALTGANVDAVADVIPIVDTSAAATKKILVSELAQAMTVSMTAQATTSGTSFDFTSIPAWAKSITVQLNAVSTNGATAIAVQLGDSGGVEVSGYVGAVFDGSSTAGPTTYASCGSPGSASSVQGQITFTLQNPATFSWTWNGSFSNAAGSLLWTSAGAKSTSAALDRVRLTTANGSDSFDAGSANVLYA